MKLHPSFVLALAFTALAAPRLAADELPLLAAPLVAADEATSTYDESYRAGRRALDERRWSEAAGHFNDSAGKGSSYADGAHYWRAYAMHKDGRSAQALEILGELRHGYQDSSWLDDARALELEIRQGSGAAEPGDGDDMELKLLALNSLMSVDSDRAMPMLKKFLAGDHSPELRERALFVLSQSDEAEAGEMLLEVAKGDRHPELRKRAIHFLGISDAPGSAEALGEIYRSASDKEVKSSVLHSLMISDHAELLLEVAKSEPDAELRRDAIHQLGVMDSTEALRQLYGTESAVEVKKQILHSLFIADDFEFLKQVAGTESDEDLRRNAIRSLGLIGSQESTAALGEMYARMPDLKSRKAIIEALFLSDETEQLIRIARTETEPELRREAVRRLSLMDEDEALEFMTEILEKP